MRGIMAADYEKGTINITNLTKVYHLYEKNTDRIKETFSKKKYSRDHYALRDINLQIKPGESVGIVGTNGSGKSTLLKLITGVVAPTEGEIQKLMVRLPHFWSLAQALIRNIPALRIYI